jgi:hypothetical protein
MRYVYLLIQKPFMPLRLLKAFSSADHISSRELSLAAARRGGIPALS